eukprot:CAMPEP_0204448946 /NCGR_PEP_ID=MMETSP0470-20130426/99318_1 /ASSEMBLY_ACC=CAM_ASM_000385 /TAXON_ID=2969 /ORGANISM="Oxyrrhis marina" /LENGTH=150 /DNA_ID=CAMNT_0051448743 /DNA_START=306 /DNA_END=755 /DNA_ORIENTATION=+
MTSDHWAWAPAFGCPQQLLTATASDREPKSRDPPIPRPESRPDHGAVRACLAHPTTGTTLSAAAPGQGSQAAVEPQLAGPAAEPESTEALAIRLALDALDWKATEHLGTIGIAKERMAAELYAQHLQLFVPHFWPSQSASADNQPMGPTP